MGVIPLDHIPLMFPLRFDAIIFIVGLNSSSTCKHAPQGRIKSVWLDAIMIRSNLLMPSETALNTAFLSAQIANPYEEFSTLQPVNILPLSLTKTAPTLTFE